MKRVKVTRHTFVLMVIHKFSPDLISGWDLTPEGYEIYTRRRKRKFDKFVHHWIL